MFRAYARPALFFVPRTHIARTRNTRKTSIETNGADAFPCDRPVHIPGPAGLLEAITQCPAAPRPAAAVVCHPHPRHGGTMHNKVVHILASSLSELGLRTIRFNFRGVGGSAGAYAGGIGETEDVLAVLEWVRAARPTDEIWLAGFSFGAFMALRAADRFQVARLVLVAPPVYLYPELGAPPTPRTPMLVLQGEQDDIVSPEGVAAWAEAIAPPPVLRMFSDTGHFFHGRLNDLRAVIYAELGPVVPADI